MSPSRHSPLTWALRLLEAVAKVETTLARARQRRDELQRHLTDAELRDRKVLGEALVAAKQEPSSEADTVRAEIARQDLRLEALTAALTNAQAGVAGRRATPASANIQAGNGATKAAAPRFPGRRSLREPSACSPARPPEARPATRRLSPVRSERSAQRQSREITRTRDGAL